ncbi:MAG: molecular chaperone TorD family protein [Acidobacteria bacterium]|nr:molecular chaperone TorD family protein [Acidobacteriota bacterium]
MLRYPGSDYSDHLDEASRLAAGTPCGEALERFRAETEPFSLGSLQELYTRTFDLSPLCALEVGWRLYGEDYARGSFLAYLRPILLEHGIAERGELPDHLANVLPAIARLAPEKAEELRAEAALPAVEQMLQAFAGKSNPYGDLLRAVRAALLIPVVQPVAQPIAEASHV